MGNDGTDPFSEHEKPRHLVEISRTFDIGKNLVTQALWERIMGKNPSVLEESTHPVENVSWFDCIHFCNTLSNKEGLQPAYAINGVYVTWNRSSDGYRLPTEAEWAFAARGTSARTSSFAAKANQDFEYSGSDNPDEVAWTRENSNKQTHPVGQKKPNGFGLYDMSGNVSEWVWDWYDKEYYQRSPSKDPTGPESGTLRVLRGTHKDQSFTSARLSCRGVSRPTGCGDTLGMRLCRSILE